MIRLLSYIIIFSHPRCNFHYLFAARPSLAWPVQFNLGCGLSLSFIPVQCSGFDGVRRRDLCSIAVGGVGYDKVLYFSLTSRLVWNVDGMVIWWVLVYEMVFMVPGYWEMS